MSVSARIGIGFMKALAHVPLPVLRGAGTALGRLLHSVALPRRRVVDANLKICFPELSDAQRSSISRETFVYFAQSWLDRAWLWHAPREVVESRLAVRGAKEDLDELASGEQAVILFAPHFYGLDAGATTLTMHMGRPSMTIYTTQRDPMVDAWAREGRTRFGNVTALERTDGVKPVLHRLRKGEVLYLLPDMDFGPSQSIFVPFFGVDAATVPSLSRFAQLGRAIVMPVLTRVTPQGYEVELLPRWEGFPTGDIVADTTRQNEMLEGYIRTMPSQYYWVHRRFKTRPEGTPTIY
ncbi:lysophospholipid acyltransferase family protein [Variovorax sp. OV329]|uniref:lysophospholipid acyltransferase family protein n=1 Tax=Variovorax sp. OV329 TaxID=1882825 RepID=UPI0008EBA303|nr:lipid A biosynthesis acyltransferase [Variovorax sp. OV329]SFM18882.1 KDO2-lipid IV(A) lauroyltransferase [Variovorax sp. OV329]